jgi:hypothetical protein
MEQKRVGLWPVSLWQERQWLWRVLEQLFPLSFVPWKPEELSRLDGLVVAASDQSPALLAAAPKVSCLVLNGSPGQWDGSALGGAIEFWQHSAVPAIFRGRTMIDGYAPAAPPLRVAAGDQVLASQARRPVWVHRPAADGAATRDVVSLPLPALAERAHLRDCFNGGNFLCALPLLGFLQRLTVPESFQPAPPRACFIFDDPSLRWRSYGFMNYQQLVRHAQTHNYHAAIGFIPLDAVWVRPSIAAIFRANPARLSLTIHGCNHLHLEMACKYSPAQRMAICAQALRRVGDLERQHLLAVCRVMESPFGCIDQAMFASLVALGYEAALITASQFLHHHRGVQFPPCFGLQAASCLSGGLGMIPRITIKPHWQTEAILAAFLGQPIVIAGHHQDAANGLEPLEEIAKTINGFGGVRWCSLTEIAGANYTTRLGGARLLVSIGSRRILLAVPEGVRELGIRRPWIGEDAVEQLIVKGADQKVRAIQSASTDSAPVAVTGPETIEIWSPAPNPVNPQDIPPPGRRLWPYVRRALTELRDQALPLLSHPPRSRDSAPKTSSASPS